MRVTRRKGREGHSELREQTACRQDFKAELYGIWSSHSASMKGLYVYTLVHVCARDRDRDKEKEKKQREKNEM